MRAVRLYAGLLRLLPPAVHRADGDEMVSTFAAQLTDATRQRERVGVVLRTFGRLPAVIVAEWLDRVLDVGRGDSRRTRIGAIDRLAQMCRHGARSLARSSAFLWSTVLLLGLGVGAATTVFTLVDHVMLRPLPYPAADRLFKVQNGSHSGPLWRGMQELQSVETWAATSTENVNLTGVGRPEELRATRVTRDFFALFGARPVVGRLLAGDDFESADRVVLSAGFWERTFGGDPAVVGRTIVVDGQPYVVIGVVDRSFTPPEALVGDRVDLWQAVDWTDPRFDDHGFNVLSVAGRLAPGEALAAARAEINALVEHLAAELPPGTPTFYFDRDGNVSEPPLVRLRDATTGAAVREGLGLLFGAVTLLLLVACTNVAHLSMARGVARMHEMQLRRTLGAPTRVLASQLFVESMMVGLAGTALGVLLAWVGLAAFMALIPEALPRADAVRIDTRVMGFAAAAGAVTALAFGMLPALRLVGRDVGGAFQARGRGISDSRRHARLRAGLVVAEVALSVILVVHAGSLLRAFVRLQTEQLGFRTEGVWTLPLAPKGVETAADWSRRMDAARAALEAVPGVSMATYGMTMPLEFTGGSNCCLRAGLRFPATSVPDMSTDMHVVDADYFTLLELEFLAGRPWSRADARSRPAPAVVSEQLAIQVYGSAQAAIDRQFMGPSVDAGNVNGFHITGVVADNRHYGPDQDYRPAAYIPTATIPFPSGRAHMAVRVEGPTPGLAGRLRDAVWSVEPDLPVPIVRPLTEWAGEATAQARFTAALFATFGVVALLLMAGGLYGTLLYTVGRKRRELGIRLALGDAPSRLEQRVIGRGVATAMIGCLFGAAGAWAAGKILASQVSGLEFGQPATLVGAIAVLLVVTLAASWLPARRAARTDPLEALRAE